MIYLLVISFFLLTSSFWYYSITALLIFLFPKKRIIDINQYTNLKEKCMIVIPILNGEKKINERINNVINYCNPKDFEINLISDGSVDNTFKTLLNLKKNKRLDNWNIYLDENKKNIGRALTHNQSVKKYNNQFFLFSDLDTEFTSSFPSKSLNYLKTNKACMAVSGLVKFKSKNLYGKLVGKLFLFDVYIRLFSNFSKICMKGSGPCLIIKKECWKDLKTYEDIDHNAGFMALQYGGYLQYKSDSIVYDIANNSSKKDLKARRRMTRKCLLSFVEQISKYKFNSFREYLAVIGYIIHKPLRFLFLPFLSILWILYITKEYGIIVTLVIIFFSFIIPQLNVLRTILFAYILGIFDFLKGDKSGIYEPVNISKDF